MFGVINSQPSQSMILVQRYQQNVAELPKSAANAGTVSVTNVRAEQPDQDPSFLSQTKTVTETRQEHPDSDPALFALTKTATFVRQEQQDSDAPSGRAFSVFPR